MPPPGAPCIIQCFNYLPTEVVQRDNANNIIIRELLDMTIESIIKVQWGAGKSQPEGPTFQWEMRL